MALQSMWVLLETRSVKPAAFSVGQSPGTSPSSRPMPHWNHGGKLALQVSVVSYWFHSAVFVNNRTSLTCHRTCYWFWVSDFRFLWSRLTGFSKGILGSFDTPHLPPHCTHMVKEKESCVVSWLEYFISNQHWFGSLKFNTTQISHTSVQNDRPSYNRTGWLGVKHQITILRP